VIAQLLVDAIQSLPAFRGRTRLLSVIAALSGGVFVRSTYGPYLFARLQDFTNWAAVNGAYDERILQTIRTLNEGDAFIDVGANIGIWSLVAAKRVGANGMVFAFEPQTPLLAELLRNAQRNNCQNIFACNIGVGEKTGAFALVGGGPHHSGITYIDTAQVGSSLLVNPSEGMPFVEKLVSGRRTLVKVDVEGGELSALRGLQRLLQCDAVFAVIVEIDSFHLARFNHTLDDVYEYMASLSFVPQLGSRQDVAGDVHYDEVFVRERML
jgi:FkbM family methyltransferase